MREILNFPETELEPIRATFCCISNEARSITLLETKGNIMTRLIKTTAIAALALTTAMPAFAAAHLDISNMTCAEYEDLSRTDRNKVAVMAVSELSGDMAPTIDTATATESTNVAPSGESPADASDTSATATTTSNAGDDMTRYQEEISRMNNICTFNPTTMVMEAAAGQVGKR